MPADRVAGNRETMVDVDAVLERIGGWGRYQKLLYLLGALPSIVGGIVTMAYSWTAFFMEHR